MTDHPVDVETYQDEEEEVEDRHAGVVVPQVLARRRHLVEEDRVNG